MSLHFQIFCALCVCLTSVSKGAEFGFTSQLTYSLKHGDQKMEVTDEDVSWIGMMTFYHYLCQCPAYPKKWFICRCSFISWMHDWLFCWRLDVTAPWKKDHDGCMQFYFLHHMDYVVTENTQSGIYYCGTLLDGCHISSIYYLCRWDYWCNNDALQYMHLKCQQRAKSAHLI